MLCDCNKCFDKCHIERSYEYVKRHRKLYGQQSLGENAPLDPATPSNDYLAASGSSPPPNSPSVSSRSQEALLLSSPLGVLDNLGRGHVSQSPRNLSNAAFSPLDSGSISDTQDRPSVPSVSNSLQSNSPGLPKPTFTLKFSPGSIGLCTPCYLLSQRKPGTIFIPDPSPIPPGRNITLKLPPWRQDYCIDNDGWLWDFDRYSPPPRPNAQFLGGAGSRFGISFSISIDGFRAFKKGPYTVNGVYIVINNLPYYLRNRVENTIPVMIMPGPNKASAYAYDQMLQPLVNDLIELARGVHMRVYQVQFGRAQRELVHGHLHSMILDYVAQIENCGHTALAKGFEFENYELRDPHQYLQAKYNWLENPDQRAHLYKQNGTRWTILDQVPGFYGNTPCPVDAMHVFATGTTQWLFNQLIVGPGMLGALYNSQPQDEQPLARFNRGLSVSSYHLFAAGSLHPGLKRKVRTMASPGTAAAGSPV
ncbi:Transposase family Tnp2 protein [Ceratobasidium sp. AG-Ba]|nr:Transposase family Tnp2 protein [Ceratobasidium sp. AG-Ba]